MISRPCEASLAGDPGALCERSCLIRTSILEVSRVMALTENCALACLASASNTMPSSFFWVLGSGAARHDLPETYGPPGGGHLSQSTCEHAGAFRDFLAGPTSSPALARQRHGHRWLGVMSATH
jgi:hypothetical protein